MLPVTMHWMKRWWKYRRIHRMFGFKFWAMVVGAAPLDPELEAFWGRLGFVVVQGYGLTETAPIVTLNHPLRAARGAVGKPIAGVEVRIAEDGEILVRGENVTRGYYNAPEETRASFEDGWFHTGDIGELDDKGQLHIRGRKKEMIVTPEGLNVFPEDVERVLNELPGVTRVRRRRRDAAGIDRGTRAGGDRRRARDRPRRPRAPGERGAAGSSEDPRRGALARARAAAHRGDAEAEAARAETVAGRFSER